MKEACMLVQTWAAQYPRFFEVHIHKYIQDDCLLKALHNGKKVIVDLADECTKEIIKHCINNK